MSAPRKLRPTKLEISETTSTGQVEARLIAGNEAPLQKGYGSLDSAEGGTEQSLEDVCPICLEDFAGISTSGVEKVHLPGCNHAICKHCLQLHCGQYIDAKVVPIPCPRFPDCKENIPLPTLEPILVNSKYQRCLKLHLLLHPDATECPSCSEIISIKRCCFQPSVDDAVCSHCNTRFCLVHSLVHPDMPCEIYQATPAAKAIAPSERALDLHTKKCSRCGCRLQRKSGCDLVVCGHCNKDMCWACETHEHLTGTRTRVCSGCSQAHINLNAPDDLTFSQTLWSTIQGICVLVCIILLIVLWAGIATILALCTLGFGGFFGCGHFLRIGPEKTKRGTFKHGIAATIVVIFIPLVFLLQTLGFLTDNGVIHDLLDYDGEIPFLEPVDHNQNDGSDGSVNAHSTETA